MDVNMPKNKWLFVLGFPFVVAGFLSATAWRFFEIGQIVADYLFEFADDEAPSNPTE